MNRIYQGRVTRSTASWWKFGAPRRAKTPAGADARKELAEINRKLNDRITAIVFNRLSNSRA